MSGRSDADAPTCEPPIGSTVTDERGHKWKRHDDSRFGWRGCLTCESEPMRWSWHAIRIDTHDSVLTIEEKP